MKKGKRTISQYEILSLESTKWLSGSLAHICIVIAFPVHYSIDPRLLFGCNWFQLYFKLCSAELYNYVSSKLVCLVN